MNDWMDIEWLGQQLLRGVVFLALAWAACFLVRRGSGRYAIWRAVFVILFAMGIAGLGPGLHFVEIRKPEKSPVARVETGFPTGTTTPTDISPPPACSRLAELASGVRLPNFLVLIWLGGVILGLGRLSISWVVVRNLARSAKRVSIGTQTVFESARIATPVTFGIFRPRILVPSGFADWPQSDREMALRHELAHVLKRDGAWQLLAAVAAILHWPNPLVWLALRQMGRDRELCADAEVVRSGFSPRRYSELLVRLASSAPTPMGALPMARKSTVPMRVERILRAGESGKAALGPLIWLTIGLLAGVGLTLGVTSLMKPADESQINVVTRFVEATPDGSGASELFTKVFLVPPGFTTRHDAGAAADPFAPGGGGETLPTRKTAREVLEEIGIAFPEGATAIYNPGTSKLIVRNEQSQLDLVEAYVQSMVVRIEKQIYITSKFLEVAADAEIDFFENQTGAPELAGVFTAPQFQLMIRELTQKKGVDLLSAPSVVTRSGQRATVEVGVPLLDVTATTGADGFTIDLHMHLSPAGNPISTSITIWDGQTVAWTEPLPNGKLKVVFVTAKLVDPAGKPLHREENVDGTEKRP